MNNTFGYWWTTDDSEGWEGFAPTRAEALEQIKTCCADLDEIQLRPGYDSLEGEDDMPITFLGPGEFIQINS